MNKKVINKILKCVALGMSVGVLVMSIMGTLEVLGGMTLLSIGLVCMSISSLDG